MTSRRTLILIVAIAIGALAAYVLWSYIQGVEDGLNEGAARAEVFMVITDINEDTRGEDAQRTSIEVRDIPNDLRPANAITDLTQITGKVAKDNLVANEILKVGDFIDPIVKQTSFSDLLPEGMITVSINMDRVRAAGGFLAPGDEVNMMVVADGWQEIPEEEGVELTAEEKEYNAQVKATPYQSPTRFFYQKVKILAIDNQLAPRAGEEVDTTVTVTGGGIITIAAPPEAALRLLSIPSGSVLFNLLPDGYEPQLWEAISAEEIVANILPGEDENLLTPYGPGGFDAFVAGESDGSIAFDDSSSSLNDNSFTGQGGGGASDDSGSNNSDPEIEIEEDPIAEESPDTTIAGE
ncbi:MAG: Flp pilus assembly protein CpaB [Acidimicrobiales bacterium]